jgi:uncharacterized protein (TIGR02246 family)
MFDFAKLLVLAASLVALAACTSTAAPETAADKSAVRAVSIAWKNAYNAGNATAVAALYAEDAVLSAPGEPAIQGKAAIREYFVKRVAEFSVAGLTVTDAPIGDVGASGDLAFQWETYRVTDKSGALVDAGKLLTLFQRKSGNWMIIGDTWNSDAMRVVSAGPAATAVVPSPK